MSKSVEDNAKNKTEKMRPDVTRFIGNSGCAKRHASVCACAYSAYWETKNEFLYCFICVVF